MLSWYQSYAKKSNARVNFSIEGEKFLMSTYLLSKKTIYPKCNFYLKKKKKVSLSIKE